MVSREDLIETARQCLKEEIAEQIKAARKEGAEKMLKIVERRSHWLEDGFTVFANECWDTWDNEVNN